MVTCENLRLSLTVRARPSRSSSRTRKGTYVLDVPFPATFDAPNKRWKFEDGPIGWDQVLKRWKARGPMNDEYVASLQRGWSPSG